MMDNETLKKQFEEELWQCCRIAKEELHYNPTYFMQMMAKDGAVKAAEYLVLSDSPATGFTTLWEKGRLELSVEAHVSMPKYASLFSEVVIQRAEKRLKDYGFNRG